jgi:hypothetical protein
MIVRSALRLAHCVGARSQNRLFPIQWAAGEAKCAFAAGAGTADTVGMHLTPTGRSTNTSNHIHSPRVYGHRLVMNPVSWRVERRR